MIKGESLFITCTVLNWSKRSLYAGARPQFGQHLCRGGEKQTWFDKTQAAAGEHLQLQISMVLGFPQHRTHCWREVAQLSSCLSHMLHHFTTADKEIRMGIGKETWLIKMWGLNLYLSWVPSMWLAWSKHLALFHPQTLGRWDCFHVWVVHTDRLLFVGMQPA